MTTIFWLFGGAYLLGWVLAPFPYWPSYFYLWKVLLRSPWPASTRLRLGAYLLRIGLFAPVFTLFWFLDEIFCRGYHKREINPVFIVGQPRCGTTFLHRTLGSDDDVFFTVRHIEWRYPSIVLQKFLAVTGLRALLLRSSYWSSNKAGRLAAKMHPNKLADPEEDGIFFEENYLHHFFLFLRFPDNALLKKLGAFDQLSFETQQRMLMAHRKCIQKIAWLRGEKARVYLSKEVTSHNKIQSLRRMYPDARFIVTVRPVENFLPSLIALVKASTASKTGLDPDALPGWQEAMTDNMREQCNLLVSLCEESIPASHQLRVSATIMMKDIVAAVAEIYRFLGIPLSDEFYWRLQEIEENQRLREPGYSYDMVEAPDFENYNAFVAQIDEAFKRRLELIRKNNPAQLSAKRKSA